MKSLALNRLLLALVASATLATVAAPNVAQANSNLRAERDGSTSGDSTDAQDRRAARQDARQQARQDGHEEVHQDPPRPLVHEQFQQPHQQFQQAHEQNSQVRQAERQPLIEQRAEQRAEQRSERIQERQPLFVDAQTQREARQLERQDAQRARQESQQANRQAALQDRHDVVPHDPLAQITPQERQHLARKQHDQAESYHEQIHQPRAVIQQQDWQLQHQNRPQQYRAHRDYCNRRLRIYLSFWNNRDRYYNDDYYFAQPNYRYYYDNDYYYINRYQADLIRQALNYGYQEGFQAGRADRYDHWGYDYRSNYIYQDADYGYYGYYVREDEYNYYFREGFQRGYEDGYYSRSRYGHYDRGAYNLLGTVLDSVFRLELLR